MNFLFSHINFYPLLIYFISLIPNTFVHCQPDKTSLFVNIKGLQSNQGKVLILLFNNSSGFPEDDQKAYKSFEVTIENKYAGELFTEIPEGKYAISVLHDSDGDGEMKKNGIGHPAEPFGFSNDPSIFFGVPSFGKCSFEVKAGIENTVTINLK